MKSHVDLDEIYLKVHSSKTKELLKEVYDCYGAGAYRSSLVTLWTVLVSDLFFKLEELSEIYEDTEASRLISDIEDKWKDKPTNSEWEFKLVKDIKDKYDFIPDTLFVQIEHLKDLRNICAHPTFKRGYELFHPNAETCKGMIRTLVEELFSHSPMFHSEISAKLLADIAENKNVFAKIKALEKYLDDKYLSKSTDYVLCKLFRTLWKLVFRTENDECNENRKVNYKALKILTKKKPYFFLKELDKEKDFYNNISSNRKPMYYFTSFLVKFPDFARKVQESNLLLARETSKDSDVLLLKSSPLFDNDSDWEEVCQDKLLSSEWKFQELIPDFLKRCSTTRKDKFLKLVVTRYGACGSFNSADSKFAEVEKCLFFFTVEHIKSLVKEIEGNNQIWGRGRALRDHEKLVRKIRGDFLEDEPGLLDNFPQIDRFPLVEDEAEEGSFEEG